MNNSSDNLGWEDGEDTLPPIPDEPEHFGPDTLVSRRLPEPSPPLPVETPIDFRGNSPAPHAGGDPITAPGIVQAFRSQSPPLARPRGRGFAAASPW